MNKPKLPTLPLIAALITASGCAHLSPQKTSADVIDDLIAELGGKHEGIQQTNDDTKVSAIGCATSRNGSIAIQKARTAAASHLARHLKRNINDVYGNWERMSMAQAGRGHVVCILAYYLKWSKIIGR